MIIIERERLRGRTQHHPTTSLASRTLFVAGSTLLLAGLAFGCSDGGRPELAGSSDVGWLQAPNSGVGGCSPGAVRECGVTLEQQGGIVTCYRGVQYCEDDRRFGDCVEGEITKEPDPTVDLSVGMSRTLALSSVTPVACTEACDPNCRVFTELAPAMSGSTGGSSGGGASCTHDTCTVDPAPLSASCGSCVATVCAADASCCSVDWDQTCVNLAYTKCLNRLPPLGLCDFGVFSSTTLATANRPSAGASIGSVGDLTIGTDAVPSMIVTKGNLSIMSPNGKNVTTSGGVWVGGSVTSQNGGGAKYTGDWHVGGGIDMNGGNTIVGTVRARQSIKNVAINGAAYTGGSFTSVTGTGSRTANSNHAAPMIEIPTAIPTRSVSCSGTTDKVIERTTVTLAPGNYRDVTLQNGNSSQPSVLILSPGGKYTFRNLTINSGCQYCKIQLGTTSSHGPWDVSVCQRAMLEGPNSYIAGYNGSKLTQPEKFVLYVHGSDPGAWQYAAKIGNDFKFVGVLMVPNGTFRSEDRGTIDGALWAKAVSAGTDLGAKQISRAACEELELPGTLPTVGTCPISTTVTQPVYVDEYVYEAECPDGSSARWKNLTWTTAVPASSTVKFSAKVGSDPTSLAAQAYTLVGTAKSGSPNTQTCSLSGPAPVCPVALTDQLGLGYNQGQYLSLQVERDLTGGAPTVTQWNLTYTCQYEE